MKPFSRRILFSGLILLLSGLSSVAIYASATTFLTTNTTVTHLQGVGGGFTDNSRLWTIATDQDLNTSGLVVYSLDRASAGTSSASPSNFFFFCSPCQYQNLALVSNGVTAGDWVLRLQIANTTSIPVSTTWSINIALLENGFFSQVTTLYFKSPASLSAGGYRVVAVIDMGNGGTLTTPFAYAVTVNKV